MERQHHTGLSREEMKGVHYMLVGGKTGRIKRIIAAAEEDEYTNILHRSPETFDFERGMPWAVMEDDLSGMRYAALCHHIGPSCAEIFMSELLQVIDYPATIIRVGTAGTMQKDVRVGDVVIATGCIRAESTSFMYARSREDDYVPLATPRVIAALESAVGDTRSHTGLKVTKGSLYWEIGAVPMSERVREFNRIAAEGGVMASSMESSVIYTMADRYSCQEIFPDGNADRHIRAGTIVAIVNSPADEGEEQLFDDQNKEAQAEAEGRAVGIGMNALKILHAYDKGPAGDRLSQATRKAANRLPELEAYHQAAGSRYRREIRKLEDSLNAMHPMWSIRHAV